MNYHWMKACAHMHTPPNFWQIGKQLLTHPVSSITSALSLFVCVYNKHSVKRRKIRAAAAAIGRQRRVICTFLAVVSSSSQLHRSIAVLCGEAYRMYGGAAYLPCEAHLKLKWDTVKGPSWCLRSPDTISLGTHTALSLHAFGQQSPCVNLCICY